MGRTQSTGGRQTIKRRRTHQEQPTSPTRYHKTGSRRTKVAGAPKLCQGLSLCAGGNQTPDDGTVLAERTVADRGALGSGCLRTKRRVEAIGRVAKQLKGSTKRP